MSDFTNELWKAEFVASGGLFIAGFMCGHLLSRNDNFIEKGLNGTAAVFVTGGLVATGVCSALTRDFSVFDFSEPECVHDLMIISECIKWAPTAGAMGLMNALSFFLGFCVAREARELFTWRRRLQHVNRRSVSDEPLPIEQEKENQLNATNVTKSYKETNDTKKAVAEDYVR